jgi:hypothetical protein
MLFKAIGRSDLCRAIHVFGVLVLEENRILHVLRVLKPSPFMHVWYPGAPINGRAIPQQTYRETYREQQDSTGVRCSAIRGQNKSRWFTFTTHNQLRLLTINSRTAPGMRVSLCVPPFEISNFQTQAKRHSIRFPKTLH